MDNSRRIAFSAKRLTSSHGRALVRAAIEFRHAKRLVSRSSRFWRVAFRVCLAIAAPFIVIAIFALGAVFGWPAMVGATVALVTLCVWRDRHQIPERLAALRPANVVPRDTSTLVKLASFIAQTPLDENTLRNELWRAWYWGSGLVAILVVLVGFIIIGKSAGIAAMLIAMMLFFLVASRLPSGSGMSAEEMSFLVGGTPTLPPSGTRALPGASTPQVGQSRQSVLPGPKRK